jgi:hypothetical protein
VSCTPAEIKNVPVAVSSPAKEERWQITRTSCTCVSFIAAMRRATSNELFSA